jgi:hypothetical protein
MPAKDFWSVILYNPQTRSELQTSQPYPNKNGKRDPLATSADGSVNLDFGSEAPAGKETNWAVYVLAPLRPARFMVRQELAAG